jgi:uncharacterized protein
MGFEVVRVRDHGGIARIEIMPDDMLWLLEMRDAVTSKLINLGFAYVTLDIIGFRSGSMDEVILKSSQ